MNEVSDTYSGELTFSERPDGSMTGSEFAASIFYVGMNPDRELGIKQQLLLGNIPSFLRRGLAVPVSHNGHSGVFWALPDYLAVGSDDDYVRVPLNPLTATAVADTVGATLPTRSMVNAIWAASQAKLTYIPKAPTSEMSSTGYFTAHSRAIQSQLGEMSPANMLVAGHKKDVVLCRALSDGHHSDRVAIYGWCKQILPSGDWEVIQDLNCTSHNNLYCDYSHGIRLVSTTVFIDGQFMHTSDVLQNKELCGLLSDEGEYIMTRYPNT